MLRKNPKKNQAKGLRHKKRTVKCVLTPIEDQDHDIVNDKRLFREPSYNEVRG